MLKRRALQTKSATRYTELCITGNRCRFEQSMASKLNGAESKLSPVLQSCMGASVEGLSRHSNLINSLGPFSECIKFARAFWFFSFSDKASTHAQTHSQQAPFVC